MEVHHIGYMVKRMERSVEAFRALGYTPEAQPVWDEERKASICFLQCGGGYFVNSSNPRRTRRYIRF